MELKYKERKIRDLIVFQCSILPEQVNIRRHDVEVVFKQQYLDANELTVEEITKKIQPVIPRQLVVTVVND